MHPPTSTSTPMNSSAAGAAKKSLQSFFDEERRSCVAPAARSSFESDDHHRLSSARTSCVSASSAPLVHTTPCSVESPWIRSPLAHIAPNYHCLASLYRSEGSINSMTTAKNYVITSSSSRRIHAWKLPDCSDMGCINASTGEIHAVLASGNLLISTHGDFRIRLWDVALAAPADRLKAKKMATLPQRRPFFRKKVEHAHKDRISCVALNNADMLVYTGSLDHTVKVWSVAKKRCIDSFPAHDAQINAIAVNQHDGCVFTCSSDGKVKIWRRLCKESAHILTVTLKFQPSPINALALTHDAHSLHSIHSPCVLYSGSSDGLINFWTKEGASGRYNHGGFLQGHHFAVLCLVAVRDLVLSGSEDATIRVWRRDEVSSLHSCVVVIDGHHGPVKCLAAVMEGNEMVKGVLLVYSASMDQTLKVWRVRVCNEERCSVIKVRKSETGENEECRMSPVLSPSWVQKKIQGTDYM